MAKFKIVPLGKGLFQVGGDLGCTYPLLGTTPGENSLTYHFEPYDIIVMWELGGDGVSRINPSWIRQYNSESKSEEVT